MISDLTDLEPLLGQYDAGEILVGPLLCLSLNSNFRYFEIAGNGNKIYESIGLGFSEAETDAQRQREGIVEILKSRFDKVTILGSHLEMAETAHQLWPNQETTRAVVAASLDAKLRWPKTGGNESFDDGSRPGVVQEEFDKQPVDEVAQEWVAHATKVDPALTYEPPSTDDRKQPMTISRLAQVLAPMSLPDANSSWPLSGDRAVIQQQRRFGLDDVVGLAVLETKDAEGDIPEPVGEAGARSPTSAMLRFGAAVGSAAVIAACVMVFPSMWKAAHEPVPAPISAPLTPVNRDNGESERMTRARAGAAPVVEPTSSLAQVPSAQAQSAPAGQLPAPARGPQAVSAPVADPSSSSAQVPSAQAEPAPVSEPQSTPAQTGRTQAEAAPVDEPSPSSAEVPSAQAEPAPVSEPQSPPVQTGRTQPEAAPFEEPSSSSARIPKPAPPAQTESAQAGAAPVTEPSSSPTQIPSAQGEAVPPARTESTQAEAAATSALSSSPTFPSAQVGAPVSQPQSSPAQTESTQAEAAPTTLASSPPPQSASAPVGTGPAPPPPSAQAPSARAEAAPAPALPQAIPGASPSSQPPRMANAKAEPGPVSGFPSPPAQGDKAVTGLNSDAIAMLVSRANDFLNSNDFASARPLLRRAAEAGDAKAALMLGATYDPLVMHERGAIGIASDIAQARQWYEKAAKLGSDVATQRLANLAQIDH